MNQSDHDKIQRYLNQEMNQEELADFDQRLEQDETLAELLVFELASRKAAKKKRLEAIDQAVEEFGTAKTPNYSFLKIAAVIILLLLAGFAYYFWNYNNSQALRKQRAEIALKDIMTKSATDLDVAGAEIASLLNKEQYLEAIPVINQFFDAKRAQGLNPCDYRDENLYLGSIYLYFTEEYDKAVTYLRCTAINAQPDDWYHQEIGRHLAIALIRNGTVPEAQRVMERYGLKASDLEIWDQEKIKGER